LNAENKLNLIILLILRLQFPSTKSNLVTQYNHKNHKGEKQNMEEKRKKEWRRERYDLCFLLLHVFSLFRSIQNLLKTKILIL
jgi:hypothetical protein